MSNTKTVEAGERTQHTPGPWRVETESGRDNRYAIVSECDWQLAEVHAAKSSTEQRQEIAIANARLIAVAPEMFSWMKRMAPSWDEEARAIIAKAEGRAQ